MIEGRLHCSVTGVVTRLVSHRVYLVDEVCLLTWFVHNTPSRTRNRYSFYSLKEESLGPLVHDVPQCPSLVLLLVCGKYRRLSPILNLLL